MSSPWLGDRVGVQAGGCPEAPQKGSSSGGPETGQSTLKKNKKINVDWPVFCPSGKGAFWAYLWAFPMTISSPFSPPQAPLHGRQGLGLIAPLWPRVVPGGRGALSRGVGPGAGHTGSFSARPETGHGMPADSQPNDLKITTAVSHWTLHAGHHANTAHSAHRHTIVR